METDSKLFQAFEYSPKRPDLAPESYKIVEVFYASHVHEEIIKEAYYKRTGVIASFYFENGELYGSSSTSCTGFLLMFFGPLAILLTALGRMFYKPIFPYGIAMFATAFVSIILLSIFQV